MSEFIVAIECHCFCFWVELLVNGFSKGLPSFISVLIIAVPLLWSAAARVRVFFSGAIWLRWNWSRYWKPVLKWTILVPWLVTHICLGCPWALLLLSNAFLPDVYSSSSLLARPVGTSWLLLGTFRLCPWGDHFPCWELPFPPCFCPGQTASWQSIVRIYCYELIVHLPKQSSCPRPFSNCQSDSSLV